MGSKTLVDSNYADDSSFPRMLIGFSVSPRKVEVHCFEF